MRYVDTENVYMYGGLKSGLGSHSISYTSSMLFWPDAEGAGAGNIGGFSAGSNYQEATNASGYDEPWRNNTVLFAEAPAAAWYLLACTPQTLEQPMLSDTWPSADNNTFVVRGGSSSLGIRCGQTTANWSQWRSAGQDQTSSVSEIAPPDAILAHTARMLLGLKNR